LKSSPNEIVSIPSGCEEGRPVENRPEDESDLLQSDSFKKRYIREQGHLFEIQLIIEGIHCAACVFLIESVLKPEVGIDSVTLNYTTHKAKVVWDPQQINLGSIFSKISAVGYKAHPYESHQQRTQFYQKTGETHRQLIVAIFCTMNAMWIAVAQYAGYFSGMEQRFKDLFNLAEFVLVTPVLFYSGSRFFEGAWFGIKHQVLNSDFQVAFGSSVIYGYSVYVAIMRSGETYFEAVAMFITFILAGKFLEAKATRRIHDTSDALVELMPMAARVVEENKRKMVALEKIERGMVIEVLPGEKIAVDGTVLSGNSSVDESHLTGEPFPILKNKGASIYGGSLNQEGALLYQATQDFPSSVLAKIIQQVEEVIADKPYVQILADRISRHFILAIGIISVATLGVWWGINHDFEQALMNAVAVLIIGCPCALVLATPVANLAGISVLAHQKVLLKSGAQMELAAKVTDVILDKTGTITQGCPKVTVHLFSEIMELPLLFNLVALSKHPISQAVKIWLEEHHPGQCPQMALAHFEEIPGQGIHAEFQAKKLLGGNADLIRKHSIHFEAHQQSYLEKLETAGKSVFLFSINQRLAAIFAIEDPIKTGSSAAIQAMQQMGLVVHLLTGDHLKTATQVARLCHINLEQVHASVNPLEKETYVKSLHEQGKTVIMVGDGINDTLALAQADIGIAMGSGTETAIHVSDVLVLKNDLQSIVQTIETGRKTYHFIKQNFYISLIYNVIAVPLAMMGLVIPVVAAASMSLSSLLVIGNALRLRFAHSV